MNRFLSFFKTLGHLMAKALDIVHELVPEEALQHALDIVKQAEEQFLDNETRRAWAIKEVMAITHLPEGIARLAVEIAVRIMKKEASDAIAKVA